jgi:hypothetical protein
VTIVLYVRSKRTTEIPLSSPFDKGGTEGDDWFVLRFRALLEKFPQLVHDGRFRLKKTVDDFFNFFS